VDVEIVVDSREAGSELPDRLARQKGVLLAWSMLKSADYSIRGVIGIERKTAVDFAKSILDGRLFAQMSALRRAYERPLLLLEGFPPDGDVAGVSRPALSGALVSVAAVFGVPVLLASGPDEAAEMIAMAGRQFVGSSGASYVRPGYRPKGWRKRALYILQGLPGVGPSRAAALLDGFGSVRAVCAADERPLAGVRGIGPAGARKIRIAVGEDPSRKAPGARTSPAGSLGAP
jgi:Fanconi anemia group M protein